MVNSFDRFMKKMTKLAYYVGLVMILSGMFLSLVSQQAQAAVDPSIPAVAQKKRPTATPQKSQPTSAPQQPTAAPQQPTSAPAQPTSAPSQPTQVPPAQPTAAPTQPSNPKDPNQNPVTPPTNVIINNGPKGIMVVPEGFSLQNSGINAQAEFPLVITYECGFYGSTFYTWMVTNPNSVDVAYTWLTTAGGSESGSGVVHAHDYDTFTTPIGPRTVAVYVDNVFQGSATSNENQRWCKRDVQLSYTCSANGILFSIYNPNGFSLPYTYDLDGVTGSGNVPAGGTDTVFATTTGAHTLTVSYSHRPWNRSVTITTNADTCVVVTQSDLQLAYSCIANIGQIQWSVSNPNAVPVDFSWSQQGGQSGSGTVPANGSLNFVTTPGGVQTVSITFAPTPGTSKTISQTSAATFCTVPPPPQNLSISYACVNGQIQWTVDNPNAFTVGFNWSRSGSTDSGSDTAPANGSKVFYTSPNGAQTVSISWTINAESHSTSATTPAAYCTTPPPPLPLTVSYACVNNQIEWTVNNPNAFAVGFTWSRAGSTDSGSDTAPANGSVMFFTSPNGAQTVNIGWSINGVSYSASGTTPANFCVPPPPPQSLTISYACVNNQIQWTVTNPNAFAVGFTWARTGSTDSGSDTAPANGSVMFYTSPNGAQTVTIGWTINAVSHSASSTTPDQYCVTPPPPLPLTVSFACVSNQIQWTVNNPNAFAVGFTWSRAGSSDSGSDSAPAHGSVMFYTSPNGAQTVNISWTINATAYSASGTTPADYCTATTPQDLTISYACVNGQIQWTVHNPNNFAVGFTWSRAGSSDSGSDTAPANNSKVFTTSPAGAQTVSIVWTIQNVQHTKSATTPADYCVPPKVKDLKLSFSCGVVGEVFWTVTNPNNFAVGFTWSEKDGDSGSGTAPANKSLRFHISGEHKTVSISWASADGQTKTITKTAPTYYCATTNNNPPPSTPPLGVPPAAGGGLLIPNTGADLTAPVIPFAGLPKPLMNLGMVFLGMAFIMQGVTRKPKKK